METGIGKWSEQGFIERFKFYEDPAHVREVGPNQLNSIMPWTMFARMDLKAVYHYLHSLKPIENKVAHFSNHIVQR